VPSYELYIPGIVCAACIIPIDSALKECKEVKSVNVDSVTKIATITTHSEISESTQFENNLKKTLDDIGFDQVDISQVIPELNDDGVETATDQKYDLQTKRMIKTKKLIRNHWIKGITGVLTGISLLALTLSGLGIPMLIMGMLALTSSLVTLYLGKETYKKAITKLTKTKTLSMESLFTVSTLIAVIVTGLSFIIPGLPMLLDAALLILGFKHIGKGIEEATKKSLTSHSFRDYAPKFVTVELKTGTLQTKFPVKDLMPGHTIILYKGQTIPADGTCLTENTSIYNTRVTGRTLPQSLNLGQFIHAGSTVPDDVDFIKMHVTAKEANSYLSLLDRRIKEADQEKAPLETATAKILQYFIPTIFAIAIISAIVIGVMVSPIAAIQCGLAVLVSACPCTLGLVTPLAIKTGLTKAADHGVNFKNGKSIEAAAQVDTIVLDLNGTLTTGIPIVKKSTIPKEMYSYLLAMEDKAENPIAKAICAYINKNRFATQTQFNMQMGKLHHAGINAIIDKEEFIIGNKNMMAEHKIDTTAYDQETQSLSAEHIIYFVRNKKIIGYIALEDPLREDAKPMIQQLKAMGKKIHICTGADENTARKYADALGIDDKNIRTNCTGSSPNLNDNTKTRYISELTKKGYKVAMIGDAGNDAPAIAASHFGIAINSAASDKITKEKAGAVINQNSLWAVVNAFSIAGQTVANIKQNLAMSISYNLLAVIAFSGLLVAIGFVINPALGALLMILQTGLILMNLKRFKRQALPSLPQPESDSKRISNSVTNGTYKELSPILAKNTLEFQHNEGQSLKEEKDIQQEKNRGNLTLFHAANKTSPSAPANLVSIQTLPALSH
jgi:Cu2+-exporting ATPase